MTDEFTLAIPPIVAPGTYPAVLTKWEPVTLETKDGPTALIRWTFMVDAGEEQTEMDALSSQLYTPRSKARRWAFALLGVDRDVNASVLVGCGCLVVVEKDEEGFHKLMDVFAAPQRAK